MPKPFLITRPRKLTIHLPEDIYLRLSLFLTSPSSGKVGQGAYQAFFVERIGEFFSRLEAGTRNPDVLLPQTRLPDA